MLAPALQTRLGARDERARDRARYRRLRGRVQRLEARSGIRSACGCAADRGASLIMKLGGVAEAKPIEWQFEKGARLPPFHSGFLRIPHDQISHFDCRRNRRPGVARRNRWFLSSTGRGADLTNSSTRQSDLLGHQVDEPEYRHCDGSGDILRDTRRLGPGADGPRVRGQLSARRSRDRRDADFDLQQQVLPVLRPKQLVRCFLSDRSGPVRLGRRRELGVEIAASAAAEYFCASGVCPSRMRIRKPRGARYWPRQASACPAPARHARAIARRWLLAVLTAGPLILF